MYTHPAPTLEIIKPNLGFLPCVWPFSSGRKGTQSLYTYKKPWIAQELGSYLPTMSLESTFLSALPIITY